MESNDQQAAPAKKVKSVLDDATEFGEGFINGLTTPYSSTKEPAKEIESVWDDVAKFERRVCQILTTTYTPEKILEMKKNLHSPSEFALTCGGGDLWDHLKFQKKEEQCLNSSDQQAAISSKHKMSETSGTNRQDG